MITNTTRIEILGQKDAQTQVGIDRSMPALLSNYMRSSEWEAFCNIMDNALVPVQEIKDRLKRTMKIFFITFFGSMIVFILFGIFGTQLFMFNVSLFIPIMAVIGFLFMIPGILVFRRTNSARREVEKVMEDFRSTLESESAKRSDLSFHLKTEESLVVYNDSDGSRVRSQTYYYIEVHVSGATIPMGGATAPINANVVATPVQSTFDSLAMNNALENNNYSSRKSAAERLQELESVKHLISDQDYKSKKDAIIASL